VTGGAERLDEAWRRALAPRVPLASWSVVEDGRVLTEHEPERWFSSASMIKTFIAAVALDAVAQGELTLESSLPVRAEHRTGGDGVLGTFTGEVELPLLEVLRLMLAISDNTATNVVLAALGGTEPLNARLAAWGYGSRMCRRVGGGPLWSGAEALREAHTDMPSPIGLGITSVAEHQRLVAELRPGGRLAHAGADAVALLCEQQDRRALARYVGEDVAFAHKTGTDDGARHDAGLLRASGREILVGCFTDGGPHEEWVDHPAVVGMGLALAWTAELLGLDVQPPPGVPPCPIGVAA
jgi:beta-lactamase class A